LAHSICLERRHFTEATAEEFYCSEALGTVASACWPHGKLLFGRELSNSEAQKELRYARPLTGLEIVAWLLYA